MLVSSTVQSDSYTYTHNGVSQARILEWVFHFLLQGIFLPQGLNPCLKCILHWQSDSLPLCYLGNQPLFVCAQKYT